MSSKFQDLIAQARSRQPEPQADEGAAAPAPPEPAPPAPAARAAAGTARKRAAKAAPQAQAAEPEPEPEAPGARRGRPRGKRSDPGYEQITAYISKQTHQQAKIALLQEGRKRQFSELVEDLLQGWLEERAGGS